MHGVPPEALPQWSGSMHAYASRRSGVRRDEQARPARDERRSSGRSACSATRRWRSRTAVTPTTRRTSIRRRCRAQRARHHLLLLPQRRQSITDDHNNGLVLAIDQTMRGGAKNPVDDARAQLRVRREADGVGDERVDDVRLVPRRRHARAASPLERTYTEWQTTFFAHDDPARLPAADVQRLPHDLERPSVIADRPGPQRRRRARRLPRAPVARDRSGADAVPRAATRRRRASRRDLDGAIAIVGPDADRRRRRARRHLRRCPRRRRDPRAHRLVPDRPHVSERRRAGSPRVARGHRVRRERTPCVFSSGVVADDQDPEDIDDPIVNCTSPARELQRLLGSRRSRPTARRRTSSGTSRARPATCSSRRSRCDPNSIRRSITRRPPKFT